VFWAALTYVFVCLFRLYRLQIITSSVLAWNKCGVMTGCNSATNGNKAVCSRQTSEHGALGSINADGIRTYARACLHPSCKSLACKGLDADLPGSEWYQGHPCYHFIRAFGLLWQGIGQHVRC
jgi:hypothetical protein